MRKYAPVMKSDWEGYGSYENSWFASMQESKSGEWVKLSTFNDTVAMLNAQIERLKKQLEDKAKEEAPEIKVGDKLRIIATEKPGGQWEHCYKAGDIVVVERICNTDENNSGYEVEYNVVLDTNTYKHLRQVINKDDFERVVQ